MRRCCPAAFVLAAAWPALAASGDAAETAYRTSLAQEGLRQSTNDAKQALASLKAEMREFFPGQEAALDAVFGRLESLSQDEMQNAVESLRSASRTGDLAEKLQSLASAQKDQTVIGQSLRELSFQLTASRTIRELSAQLRETAKRQSVTQAEAERLSKRPAAPAAPAARAKLQAAASDQEKLDGDVQRISKSLASIADNLPAGSPLRRAAESARQDAMDANSRQALDALRNGDLPAAAASEKKVLDSLEKILAAAEPADRPPKERLLEAKRELEQIRGHQKKLADTMPSMNPRDMPRQEENANAAAALDPLLSSLSPLAGDDLASARAFMESASAILVGPDNNNPEVKAQAAANAGAALKGLDAAQNRIEAELERADRPPSAKDAAAEQIAEAAADLARARDTMNKSPENAPQAARDLEKAARGLDDAQKSAARAFVPDEVQKALEKASDALASAKPAAEKNQLPEAQASADAAAQNIQAALDGLPQAAQSSPKPSSPEAESARAQNQIARASEAAAAAQQELAKSPKANPGQLQQAAEQVQDAMNASESNGLTPEAKQSLAEAADALQSARQSAKDGQPAAAQSSTAQAQQSLAEAQSEMARSASLSQSSAQSAQSAQSQSQSPSNSQSQAERTSKVAKGGGRGHTEGDMESSGAASSDAQTVGGLSPRDREAAAQLQAVKPPPEFAPAVRQYYKNLAEDVTHD